MDLKKYEFEITHIINELKDIERGNFYESNNNKGTPSAKTIAKNLSKEFIDLIDKICKNKPGIFESNEDTEK